MIERKTKKNQALQENQKKGKGLVAGELAWHNERR
jgi:hypothetical protein